jgi:hypothetical protein
MLSGQVSLAVEHQGENDLAGARASNHVGLAEPFESSQVDIGLTPVDDESAV